MNVDDAMSTDLVVRPQTTTLQAIGTAMVDANVGSVLISHENKPVGIVTETDLIEAAVTTEAPLTAIETETIMSTPLETIERTRSIQQAFEQMSETGVKRLVVVDELDVVGIVTLSDLVYHYSALRSEIHKIERTAVRANPKFDG